AYTYFSVLFNQKLGDLTTALSERNGRQFWRVIQWVALLLLVAAPINSFYYFVRDKLAIYWRRWMTNQFTGRYFSNRSYYELAADDRIDNPDQRMSDDINNFTQRSLQFLLILINGILQLIAFSAVLWSISRMLVLILVLYALIGTLVITLVFGRA